MLGYINHNDLVKMSEMITKISYIKDNTSTMKPEFCETCTLGKQYKVYSKEPSIDKTDKPRVCIYTDLFSDKNTLSGIGSY